MSVHLQLIQLLVFVFILCIYILHVQSVRMRESFYSFLQQKHLAGDSKSSRRSVTLCLASISQKKRRSHNTATLDSSSQCSVFMRQHRTKNKCYDGLSWTIAFKLVCFKGTVLCYFILPFQPNRFCNFMMLH